MPSYRPDPAEVRAWVERTCAEQGVPVGIEDPETIRFIAGIFIAQRRANEARARAARRRRGTGRRSAPTQDGVAAVPAARAFCGNAWTTFADLMPRVRGSGGSRSGLR
jgi:hypothetical protein